MKIMVFLHGTVIMHRNALNASREERVHQVKDKESSVYDYENYIPVGNSNLKLQKWVSQGAGIIYLSSHKTDEDVHKDIISLTKNGFPDAPVLYRKNNESYAEIAERVMPDVLIEDDCENIGGESEMTYPHIDPKKKKLIKSVVVKEFEGIDHLPDETEKLKNL